LLTATSRQICIRPSSEVSSRKLAQTSVPDQCTTQIAVFASVVARSIPAVLMIVER
jgi:hypothetical protein